MGGIQCFNAYQLNRKSYNKKCQITTDILALVIYWSSTTDYYFGLICSIKSLIVIDIWSHLTYFLV